MGECLMYCNIVRCRKELKGSAFVTSCSHIFCAEHGQESMEKEKCLACGYIFGDKYDIVNQNLNPSEPHKSMILAGLSPEKVIDVAGRALIFWSYQMYQERLYRDNAVKNAKQDKAELTDHYETLKAKHKIEVQKFGREIQNLQKELELKIKQTEELVSELAEKTRLVRNLQSQYDYLRRKGLKTNSNVNLEDCNSTIYTPSDSDQRPASEQPIFQPQPFTYEKNRRRKDCKKQHSEDFLCTSSQSGSIIKNMFS